MPNARYSIAVGVSQTIKDAQDTWTRVFATPGEGYRLVPAPGAKIGDETTAWEYQSARSAGVSVQARLGNVNVAVLASWPANGTPIPLESLARDARMVLGRAQARAH
jgi:hypothetical protein